MIMSKMNHEEIEKILAENDPEKLHEQATDCFRLLNQIPEGTDAIVLVTLISTAAFIQARAAYYAAMAGMPSGRQDC